MSLLEKYPTMPRSEKLIRQCLNDPKNIGYDRRKRHPKFSRQQYNVRVIVFKIAGANLTLRIDAEACPIDHACHRELWTLIQEYLHSTCDLLWAVESEDRLERYFKGVDASQNHKDRTLESITDIINKNFNCRFEFWQVRGGLENFLLRATNGQVDAH
tara:strand:- start:46 stop:519 length:474 start_codon:yes stop_codon:yes gene_type:complete